MLAHQPVTNRTVNALLATIQTKGIKAGDLLPTEPELTVALGVSRSILREAVGYLKGMGILESKRGCGVRLRNVDPVDIFRLNLELLIGMTATDMRQLHLLRRALEVGVIDRAVRNATPEQQQRIVALADQYEREVRRDEPRYDIYIQMDLEFHCAICAPADFPLLDVLNKVIVRFFCLGEGQRSKPIVESREHLSLVAEEHRILANAFLTAQPEVATLCLQKHLRPPNAAENDGKRLRQPSTSGK